VVTLAALDNVNGIQFSHQVEQNPGGRLKYNVIKAHDADREVGEMRWSQKTGEIQRVEVQGRMGPNGDANGGSYQHRGIATHMYEAAKEIPGKGPTHSSQRTDAGEGWSKAVGGRRPRRVQ
jgi:histone acetyltransferase (RNA polymerase elongator complex component)